MVKPSLIVSALLATAWNGPVHATLAEHIQRSTVAGIDVVTYTSQVKDVVVIVGALPAGDAMAGTGNIALPTLAGMMLDRGTRSLDKYAIADRLDNVGAEISFAVGMQSLEIRAKCLKKDLPLVVGLIAAELRTPALSAAEFAKAKLEFAGSLQNSLQNSEARAGEAFGRAIYAEGSPNRPHAAAEYLAAVKAASLDELKGFISKYYGSAHLTLVLAGDVTPAAAQSEVAKDFAGWGGGQDYLRGYSGDASASMAAGANGSPISVPLPGKPSVTVMLGQATGLRYRDPDALALRLGTAIFGRGFTGRLMGTVRDKEGLTYNIGAGVGDDSIVPGDWAINASFAPALLDKGLGSTRRELDRWWSDGVSEAELADHKQGLIGTYLVGLSTTGGVAGAILTTIQRGYDVAWLDRYPGAIGALTLAEVNAAIKAHLDPKTMVVVEAGSVPVAGSATAPPAHQ